MTQEEIIKEIQKFKERRDALLENDDQAFVHDLSRLISFIDTSTLFQEIFSEIPEINQTDFQNWLVSQEKTRQIDFPPDEDLELAFRYQYLIYVNNTGDLLNSFSHKFGYKFEDRISLFKEIIAKPLLKEIGDRAAMKVGFASKEARDLQAVPFEQVPLKNTTRIFLSHKSIDKPRVRKYYDVLLSLGFEPWLDVEDLSAGDNLERTLLQGFKESCAAVFFITEYFQDERYLATEIDYAIREKRAKDKRFALITLRFYKSSQIPELLQIYVWKDVEDDLEGLYEIIKALPIELGPVRWKKEVL